MNAWLFLAFGLTFSPADDVPIMPRSPAPERQLRDHLHGEVHKAMDARRAAIAALKTPEDVARRQKDLRQKFLNALGGVPERTPLNGKTVGKA